MIFPWLELKNLFQTFQQQDQMEIEQQIKEIRLLLDDEEAYHVVANHNRPCCFTLSRNCSSYSANRATWVGLILWLKPV